MRSSPPLLGACVAVLIAGCGGAGLSAEDNLAVAKSVEAQSYYCLGLLDEALERGNLSQRDYAKGKRAVDWLIDFYQAHPDAEYDGQPLRALLVKSADDLRSCAPADSRRLLDVVQ